MLMLKFEELVTLPTPVSPDDIEVVSDSLVVVSIMSNYLKPKENT